MVRIIPRRSETYGSLEALRSRLCCCLHHYAHLLSPYGQDNASACLFAGVIGARNVIDRACDVTCRHVALHHFVTILCCRRRGEIAQLKNAW